MPADSFTSILRLRQQGTGNNANTWGSQLNAAVFQLLEDSVAGRVAIPVAAVDVTLSTNNGANDQARMSTLSLTGSPGATRNIIIPAVAKWYFVENLTNAAQNIKTAAGSALSVAVGARSIALCDGVNTFGVADTLGGLDASAFAKIASRNSYTAGNADVPRDLVDGGTITVDLATGNVFKVTLAGNRTMAFTNPNDGSWADIYFLQDGTGGRTLTWPSNITWEGGAAPVFSGIPGSSDLVQLRYDIDTASYFGRYSSSFVASGGGTVSSVVLNHNDVNFDLWRAVGSPTGVVTVTLTIPKGYALMATSPQIPALDLRGFIAGSTINIINNGAILGCGGKGGRGGGAGDANSANLFFGANHGSAGGPAIVGMSSACTVNITNAAGFIWGGGGGGGGGGPCHDGDGSDVGSTGGGGGGGAGGGVPGDGGSHCTSRGNPGSPGGTGLNGTFGLGGSGQTTGGTGTAATGGQGGDWGTAGTAGASQTANTFKAPGGNGGAAGKAYEVNGGTAPAFVSGAAGPNVKGLVS